MNIGWKQALIFLGGVAAGVVLTKKAKDVKYVAADLLSRGMDAKDAIMAKVETMREDVQDLAAEAKNASDKRKAAKKALPA